MRGIVLIVFAAAILPGPKALSDVGSAGYDPVTWCASRLPAGIRVVSPEEMLWRIRMQHDPEQTKKLIQAWPE